MYGIRNFFLRLAAAWLVLAGRVSVGKDVVFCQRKHVDGGCVTIKQNDLDRLEKAAKELAAARAALGVLGKYEDFKRPVKESGL